MNDTNVITDTTTHNWNSILVLHSLKKSVNVVCIATNEYETKSSSPGIITVKEESGKYITIKVVHLKYF